MLLARFKACCVAPHAAGGDEAASKKAQSPPRLPPKAPALSVINITASSSCVVSQPAAAAQPAPAAVPASPAPPTVNGPDPELPQSTSAAAIGLVDGGTPRSSATPAARSPLAPPSAGSGSGSPRAWLGALASKLPHVGTGRSQAPSSPSPLPAGIAMEAQGAGAGAARQPASPRAGCPDSPSYRLSSRTDLPRLAENDCQATELVDAALAGLAASPADPLGLLSTLRSAAAHHPQLLLPLPPCPRPARAGARTPPACEGGRFGADGGGALGAAVTAAQRSLRSPHVDVARAAALLVAELFERFGDAVARFADDDSDATSSLVLQLLTKAAGADMQSRALQPEVEQALSAICGALSAGDRQEMFGRLASHKNLKIAARTAELAGSGAAA